MNEYHKIQTIYKRDPETKFKTLLEGQYSMPEFEYLKDCPWICTEKIDGTNIRIMFKANQITFGGKTDNAQIPATLFEKLTNIFQPLRERIAELGEEVCFYGEGFGYKIQNGGDYIPDGVDFILFDIKIGEFWLDYITGVSDIANKFGLRIVPLLTINRLDAAVELARKGFDSMIGKKMAEGIVMQPATPLMARSGKRIIAKIKHKDFK